MSITFINRRGARKEKTTQPKDTKKLLKRVFSYLRPYWKQHVLLILAIIIAAVMGIMPSLITGQIIDQGILQKDMQALIRLFILSVVTLLASQLISMMRIYVNAWIAQRVSFDLRNEMYRHLQFMEQAFFTNERQGDIVTRMNGDINAVSEVLSNTLPTMLTNVTVLLSILVTLISMNRQLALIGVCVIPILMIPTRFIGKRRSKLLGEAYGNMDELNELMNETLSVSGSQLVKLFTRENEDFGRFKNINRRLSKLLVREQFTGRWFYMFLRIIAQTGPLLIYFTGGLLINVFESPGLTIGAITAMVTLTNRMYAPTRSLMDVQVNFERSLSLFQRVFDMLDRHPAITSKPDAQKPDMNQCDICFSHVRSSYDGMNDVLKDVSFTVKHGSVCAIVGESGAGKSTVAQLIPRLFDVADGKVTIAGVDVRDYDLTYLRQNIGIVTQDTYLINASIRENLRYAREDADDQMLMEACRAADIHDFIMRQPDGYDTIVGNRGLKLSGGEKQRISIARALLKSPKILLLDEATSSLDSIAESRIQASLETLMKGRTCIVIAHRLSTILMAEQILVLENGMLKESGRHADLLKADGLYKALYDTQFKRAIDDEMRGAEEDNQ